jgi:predicted acylesterase/phospholipase RssA
MRELEEYKHSRKNVTRNDFPRLAYIVSDVVIYVNTVSPQRESEYFERVLEFAEKSHRGVASADRPSLILIQNQVHKKFGPFDVNQNTSDFFKYIDQQHRLEESFRSVDFIKLPNWDHSDIYKQQIDQLKETLNRRILESKSVRLRRGTLFSDQTWFDILDRVLDNFDDQNLSMSKIFAEFVISESKSVNRAFGFFDACYGKINDKERFLKCRHSALQMLAAHLVISSAERGVMLNEDPDTLNGYRLLSSQLLERISQRTPCQEVLRGYRCTQESNTHDVHRFVTESSKNIERKGEHVFTDISSPEELSSVFFSSIAELSKERGLALYEARLRIFRSSLAPHMLKHGWISDCLICFASRADCMLACAHSFCQSCVNSLCSSQYDNGGSPTKSRSRSSRRRSRALKVEEVSTAISPEKKSSSMSSSSSSSSLSNSRKRRKESSAPRRINCPLCEKDEYVIPRSKPLPGNSGLRILSLDAGGFRGALQLAILERIESLVNIPIYDLFDVIVGSGVGGVVSMLLGLKHFDVSKTADAVETIRDNVFQVPFLERVFGRKFYEAVFGAPYKSSELDAVLQVLLNDQENLFQHIAEAAPPKVIAVCSDVKEGCKPYYFTNFPDGSSRSTNCFWKLWTASRASLSSPSYFDALSKDGKLLVDGSLAAANPAKKALEQSIRLWDHEAQVDCFVSLGVGFDEEPPKKSEAFVRYENQIINLSEEAEAVHEQMKTLLPEDEAYFRFNPKLKLPKSKKIIDTTSKKDLEKLLNAMNEYLDDNQQRIQTAANVLLARSFYTSIKEDVYRPNHKYRFPIKTRVPELQLKAVRFFLDVVPVLTSEYEAVSQDTIGLAQLQEVNSKAFALVKVTQPGLYSVSITISFAANNEFGLSPESNEDRFHISGSPFFIDCRDRAEERSRPAIFALFPDFISSMAAPVGEQIVIKDEKIFNFHRKRLVARLGENELALQASFPADELEEANLGDGDGLFACFSQLIQRTPAKAKWIRKRVSGWLKSHRFFSITTSSGKALPLHELVRDKSWDTYCDEIAKSNVYGDYLCLLAFSEAFGIKIVLFSSAEGAFLTEIIPQRRRVAEVVLLANWADYYWGLVVTVRSSLCSSLCSSLIVAEKRSQLPDAALGQGQERQGRAFTGCWTRFEQPARFAHQDPSRRERRKAFGHCML